MPTTKPHGFAWPAGLPDCKQCGRPANSSIHVNPAGPPNPFALSVRNPVTAADKSTPNLPDRQHAYSASSTTLLANVRCQICGKTMGAGAHPIGMSYIADTAPLSGSGGQIAFVAEIGNKVVLSAPATVADSVDHLPPQLARTFRERAGDRTPNLWIAGRYVEADRPNRNAAYWSSADLEMGQPSVTHGPINFLHEERHIIGAIADSRLVLAQEAAATDEQIGNHIVALGAVWPWLWPQEARVVARASEAGKLYYSMECISRAVACLGDGCSHEMTYRKYVTEKASRCEHMKAGQPRRFVDPIFQGAGIIVPPVQPGWSRADAKVLMPQAEALVEKQAAAFKGLTEAEATALIASIVKGC